MASLMRLDPDPHKRDLVPMFSVCFTVALLALVAYLAWHDHHSTMHTCQLGCSTHLTSSSPK
jgi:hypothetical protein